MWLLFALAAAASTTADDAYELVRGAPPAVRTGQAAQVSLSIVPTGGHRLLAGGPVIVRLGGDGVRPKRALLRLADAIDPGADVPRFELAFSAERAGPARLEATLTFYVCKAARCRPVETRARWDLSIAP